MTAQNIIILVISFLTILLGLLVLFKNYKNSSNVWFFLMCLFGGGWGVMKFFQFIIMDEYVLNFFINKVVYIFGILAPLAYLILTYSFPHKLKKYSKKLVSLVYLIPSILIVLVFFGILIMQDNFIINNVLHREVIFFDFLIFSLYFFVYVFAGFLILLKKYHSKEGASKGQVLYLMIGTILTFLTTGTVSIILILFNNFKYDWLGVIFLLIHF